MSVCSVGFDVVTHRWFDPAILCVIILNMVAICATYRYDARLEGVHTLCMLHAVCTIYKCDVYFD